MIWKSSTELLCTGDSRILNFPSISVLLLSPSVGLRAALICAGMNSFLCDESAKYSEHWFARGDAVSCLLYHTTIRTISRGFPSVGSYICVFTIIFKTFSCLNTLKGQIAFRATSTFARRLKMYPVRAITEAPYQSKGFANKMTQEKE